VILHHCISNELIRTMIDGLGQDDSGMVEQLEEHSAVEHTPLLCHCHW